MNDKLVARPTLIDSLMVANGDEIRAAREQLGISQAELAARAGANQQTIDKIERGLTKQSKFVPEIRKALGLPMLPTEITETMLRFADLYGEKEQLIGLRARIAGDFADPERLPVFELRPEEGAMVISPEPIAYIPRVYPVEGVISAYGILVPDDAMAPVLRAGEVAVVNPDDPGRFGGEIFLVRAIDEGRIAGMLRVWLGYGDRSKPALQSGTKVGTYQPKTEEVLNRYFWPAFGPVVARVPMPSKK